MGLAPRFVASRDLAGGALAALRIKVLVLPQVRALSPAEAKAISDFVAAGGTVIADGTPGIFDAHGRKMTKPLLADIFGARASRQRARSGARIRRLLTTHPVATLADAKQITHFYRQRWTIEQLFRVMKTKGFDIEAVRVADNGPFENLTTATLIAAIQVLQMVRERDGAAGRALEDVLDAADQPALEAVCATLEGKTERQKNPHPKGSLAYASWVCARLGGWTGYYGKPGPVVILQGFLRFKAMLHGWKLGRLV